MQDITQSRHFISPSKYLIICIFHVPTDRSAWNDLELPEKLFMYTQCFVQGSSMFGEIISMFRRTKLIPPTISKDFLLSPRTKFIVCKYYFTDGTETLDDSQTSDLFYFLYYFKLTTDLHYKNPYLTTVICFWG